MKTIVEFNNKNRTVSVQERSYHFPQGQSARVYRVFVKEGAKKLEYIYHDKQTALDVFQYECCREPVRYSKSWGGCPLNRPGVYGI